MIFEETRNWLKSENVRTGDVVTIKDEGVWVTSTKFTKANGEPKKDFVVKVDHNGTVCDMTINKAKKDVLIANYGKDSKLWIGKTCKCSVENVMIGGKMLKTIILSPIDGVKSNLQYEA